MVHHWLHNPMKFWQNQLNFAIWCATTGCGVSLYAPGFELNKSVVTFHEHYQEFNISKSKDWRIKGANHGLGVPYSGQKTVKEVSDDLVKKTHQPFDPFKLLRKNNLFVRLHNLNHGWELSSNDWRGSLMSFKGGLAYIVTKFIQLNDTANAWNEFLNDKTEYNFTNPGVVRVNESIRTYVWAILSAQSQTQTSIIGSGTELDAQKQFVENMEDAINSPSSIKRYQDVLQYAQSKVDYVDAPGLYIPPSNMELKIGQVIGYNNKIVIATDQQKPGINSDINTELITQTNTGDTGIVKPQSPHVISTDAQPQVPQHIAAKNQQHIDEKTALALELRLVYS